MAFSLFSFTTIIIVIVVIYFVMKRGRRISGNLDAINGSRKKGEHYFLLSQVRYIWGSLLMASFNSTVLIVLISKKWKAYYRSICPPCRRTRRDVFQFLSAIFEGGIP